MKTVNVEIESLKGRMWTILLLKTTLITFLLPGVLTTENGNATEYIRTLSSNVILNCSKSYINSTLIVWYKSNLFEEKEYKRIISQDCSSNRIHTNYTTKVTIPNTTCNLPNKDFYLQIESVDLTDEGNYKCEIATQVGTFSKTFSLTVIAPPNISTSCEIHSNERTAAVCTMSNGKPEWNITWQPTNEGNIFTTVQNNDSTVTVQSKYFITDTKNYRGNLICIVKHPALTERQNYTFPIDCSQRDATQVILPVVLGSLCLLCFALILAKCFFHKQLRNKVPSFSHQKEPKSNDSFIHLENIVYDSLQQHRQREL